MPAESLSQLHPEQWCGLSTRLHFWVSSPHISHEARYSPELFQPKLVSFSFPHVIRPKKSRASMSQAAPVKVNSTEMFRFEPISEKSNCRNSETVFEFAACAVQIFWKPETSTETFISIKQYGEDICFKIQPFKTEPYTVSVKRERYFLAVGITSFATCYQHGPLTTEVSITLFAWTLQLTAFVLIYCGVTIPQVAYAVIAVSLCSKGLGYPLGAACHIGRKVKNHFKSKKLVFKYLTEEEYREQGETETGRALEELRSFCRNPDFPSWLAVSRLQSPHRFAGFVLGSPHISPAETKAHDEEYGIGSCFLEEQLFETRAESEQDEPANSIHEGDEEDEDEMHKQIPFPYATELL
ncbi:transhypothetical protein [Limosa lapponica baueri]|uniref:Nuclear envelope integral membrane protein 2 n=1 Tax=Limosa lapponica baueri TaxID=1758121 RepID=A0A2I0TW09_LIMLA|nr:transhypothetical protein [Limosa lapponica baueri]